MKQIVLFDEKAVKIRELKIIFVLNKVKNDKIQVRYKNSDDHSIERIQKLLDEKEEEE